MDSAALHMLNDQTIFMFGKIQISQTGGHLNSDYHLVLSVDNLTIKIINVSGGKKQKVVFYLR